MAEVNIRNLESLIRQCKGRSTTLVNSRVTKLTPPGENYLGLVLKVEVTLRNEDGKEEKFNTVAKCLNFNLPDRLKKRIPRLYNKERAFYTDIVPALQNFQLQQGLKKPSIEEIFPILYAYRSSLDENSKEPDSDAVLLFENLNEHGYTNADRTIGFDLEGAQLILRDLAFLHAAPIAFKLKKPEEFENKIKKHLKSTFDFNKKEIRQPPPPLPPPLPPKENVWIDILKEYEEIKPYLKTLEEVLKIDPKSFEEKMCRIPKEPFVSITHNDLWTNNTMQIFNDEKPIKNKLIDFQEYLYDSITKDLLFFICTSVTLSTFQEHFDDLIKFYHKNFINILEKLGCDINPFSYENLLKELNEEAVNELKHIIFMLIPIFGKKGETALEFSGGSPQKKPKTEKVSEAARNRAVQIVQMFGRKDWI